MDYEQVKYKCIIKSRGQIVIYESLKHQNVTFLKYYSDLSKLLGLGDVKIMLWPNRLRHSL